MKAEFLGDCDNSAKYPLTHCVKALMCKCMKPTELTVTDLSQHGASQLVLFTLEEIGFEPRVAAKAVHRLFLNSLAKMWIKERALAKPMLTKEAYKALQDTASDEPSLPLDELGYMTPTRKLTPAKKKPAKKKEEQMV